MKVIEYPADRCECAPTVRCWNGYGTCHRCGGAYVVEHGPLVPIARPTDEEPRS